MRRKTFLAIILSLVSIFVMIIILLIIYSWEAKSANLTFTATIVSGENNSYLIKPNAENEELGIYDLISVNLKRTDLLLGDVIKIEAQNEIMESYPPQLNVIFVEVISRAPKVEDTSYLLTDADLLMISKLSESAAIINNNKIDEGLLEGARSTVILYLDFLSGKIPLNNQPFSKLSQLAQLNVYKAVLELDHAIQKKYPQYKNGFDEIYRDLKNMLIVKYLTELTEVCNAKLQACDAAKTGFQGLKSNLNLSWTSITLGGEYSDKELQGWHDIFSGK